jgi:LysM repeat protein
MKHIWFLVLLIVIFLLPAYCFAQQPAYPVVVENGQRYYLYTVEPQDGLYAVSRKFHVSQADILGSNPAITDALKTGQKIRIPVVDQGTPVKHTVARKQTLFAIAYQYGVTVDEIIALNPDAAKGIKSGDVLLIPVHIKQPEAIPAPATPAAEPGKQPAVVSAKQTSHIVEAGETLYSLSRKYNVTVDDIKAANPDMDVLKTGMTIVIAAGGTTAVPDSGKTIAQKTVKTVQQPTRNSNRHALKVAVLLPFSLDGQTNDPTIDKFVEFYRGALIALRQLKEDGISVDVHTYDIAKSAETVNELLTKDGDIAHVDFIIGPAYSVQTKAIADFAKAHKIPAVIPFTQKVDGVETNPYLYQFNPPLKWQATQATATFVKQFKNNNIVIVRIAGTSETDFGNVFAETLSARLKQLKIAYRQTTISGSSAEPLRDLIPASKNNILIIANNNGDKIKPLISQIDAITAGSDNVAFYGFTGWEPKSMPLQHIYYPSLFCIRDRDMLTAFNRSYLHWFHTTADEENAMRYDLLGYDLMLYFAKALHEFGASGMGKKMPLTLPDNIQSQFLFKQAAPGGGYINKELYLLEQEQGKGTTLIAQ